MRCAEREEQLLCKKVFHTSSQHREENEQVRGGMDTALGKSTVLLSTTFSVLTVWQLPRTGPIQQHLYGEVLTAGHHRGIEPLSVVGSPARLTFPRYFC